MTLGGSVGIQSQCYTPAGASANATFLAAYLDGILGPWQVAEEAVARILHRKPEAKDLQVGFLAMNKKGHVGAWAIQQGFSYAVCDAQNLGALVPGKRTY